MSRIQKLIPTVLASRNLRYQQIVLNMFSGNFVGYWPLDEPSGTVVTDISGNGRNGVCTDTVARAEGVGDGKTAYAVDGTNRARLNAASMETAWGSAAEFTLSMWGRVPNATNWNTATLRRLFYLTNFGGSAISAFQTNSAANRLLIEVFTGGTSQSYLLQSVTRTGWFHVGITQSQANNRVRLFFNGVCCTEVPWRANMGLADSSLGRHTSVQEFWIGHMAHFVMAKREATKAEMRTLGTTPSYRPFAFTTIGDSITQNFVKPWIHQVLDARGYVGLSDHAVGGQSIMGHMDAQVAASATDDADVIILELGTNDDNAGNMAALQAKVESNIDILRTTNPRATLYYMGTFPRWTDNTGATPIDKSNIRAAIQAACAAKSVTYWDTYSTPWIDPGDTNDGTHPTAAGHAKIAAQVLARLP